MYNDFVARLALSFLGASQIVLDEQPITYFRSINVQGILIYLALHPPQPVSRDVLAALFWPDEMESRARANLRQSLYQLRILLGDIKSPARPFLLVTRHTVQFNSDSDYEVDVHEFLAAIENRDLATAVSIYRGDLIPGFTCDSTQFEDWLRQERQSLHSLAMAAMHELGQDHLRAGQLDNAQAIARQQLYLEPWREAAHRQLMRAFALAGDRANAFAQYEACRTVLRKELAIAPSPETEALYDDIKAGRFGPAITDQAIPPPRRHNHNLPAETVPLIGRQLELAQIINLFTRYGQRLVTIVGPGGMGKTRLALAAGYALHEPYHDGIYFVDLAPLEQAREIPTAISTSMSFQPPDKSRDVFPQLLDFLSRRKMLLVLDNFEHLLDGVVAIDDIMKACPDVAILVTSRQRLNMATESRFELGGLDYPDSLASEDEHDFTAVQLFLDSGRRVLPDFTLNEDNIAGVIRICRLVQGMPLGLILAASWLELLSPAEIADEIEGGLEFLATSLADIPPRQRSMQAVFEHSWNLLTPDEQAVLAKLSIFRGGFTRQAAEQVAGANLRILLSLVNKSLVRRIPQSGRFALHELLRQFAAARRLEDEDSVQVPRAHCRYFTRQVHEEFQRGLGFWPQLLPKKLAADRDNIHRAWDHAVKHGLAEELVILTRGMETFRLFQGIRSVALTVSAEQSLRQHGAEETSPDLLNIRLIAINYHQDHKTSILSLLDLLLPIERANDPQLLFWVYERLSRRDVEGNNPRALIWADKAMQAAQNTGNDILIKQAEAYLIWTRVAFGHIDDSTVATLEDLLGFFEPGYPNSFAVYGILWSLAQYHRSIAAYEPAISYGKRCLNITKDWLDFLWITHANQMLADIYLQQDQQDQAKYHLRDTLDWHFAAAQEWKTLGYLYAVSLDYPHLIGGPETAVSIISMVYYHPEAPPVYRQTIMDARARLEQQFGEYTFTAAWELGKELDYETAVAQVRSALEPAGK